MNYPYFENLKNPNEPLSRMQELISPFTMAGIFSDYRVIDTEVALWYRTQSIPNPTVFKETSLNLLPGVLNLINYLIAKHAQNETVPTLLFLDKSARLAAYYYQKTVKECYLLAKKDAQDLAFLKSIQLRFISPREDISLTPTALAAFKQRYRKNDFTGRVLIVDEFINVGVSVNKACKLLLLGGYNPTHVSAIGNFEGTPLWYSSDSVKGVSDSKHVSALNRMLARSLTPHKRELFMTAIKKYGWEQLSAILTAEQLIDPDKRKCPADIGALIKQIPYAYSPEHVIRYLASEEGTLALPPRADTIPAARAYRQALRLMIEKIFKQQLVEFWP